jgi:hypothetical protein
LGGLAEQDPVNVDRLGHQVKVPQIAQEQHF